MIDNLTRQYVNQGLNPVKAEKQAQMDATDAMKKIAALHEPDMFAGGYYHCKPTCMGDSSVNSSIGSQWKKIIGEMDSYADTAIGVCQHTCHPYLNQETKTSVALTRLDRRTGLRDVG